MPDEISIRPLKDQDQPQWRRLWTAYLAFYETTLPDQVFETAFSRLLSPGVNEFQGLIAESAGHPVGLAHFVYHRTLWAVQDTCYLMDLFCDPSARGQGVGRQLIEAVFTKANSDGIPSIYWQTQEFNYKGRMLYDKIGEKTSFIVYEKNR